MTFSRLGSNRMAKYQSERLYGVRTASILRNKFGSLVTKVFEPIRAIGPATLTF
jgi:hypothetical protein